MSARPPISAAEKKELEEMCKGVFATFCGTIGVTRAIGVYAEIEKSFADGFVKSYKSAYDRGFAAGLGQVSMPDDHTIANVDTTPTRFNAKGDPNSYGFKYGKIYGTLNGFKDGHNNGLHAHSMTCHPVPQQAPRQKPVADAELELQYFEHMEEIEALKAANVKLGDQIAVLLARRAAFSASFFSTFLAARNPSTTMGIIPL